MPAPQIIRDGTISNREFLQRLAQVVENYQDYCRIMHVDKSSHPPIEWLDHFQEFLTLAELERAEKKA